MAADIVKQGYVKFQSKNLGSLGVWNRKWLMLRRQSCKGPVRLEKYKDESTASVMSIYGADKKIIDLTRVDRIERLSESVKKHGISILVDASVSIQFCVGSEMEAESWLSVIRDEMHPENRQTHESFPVYMLPNDYMSTPGDCTLQLTRDSLRLLERYGERELTSWPLSGLRRFGVDRNMFTIEAGSSCPSGSGTFFFRGDDSELIYQRIQCLSQALSRTSSEGNMQSSFSMSNWGNISSIHELSNQRERESAAGRTVDQENPYSIDTSMPIPRVPSERPNNAGHRNSRAGGRVPGGRQRDEDPYSELPVDGPQINASSTGHYSFYRTPGTQPGPTNDTRLSASTRSRAVDASTDLHRVDGPYYAVSRPTNPNNAASIPSSVDVRGVDRSPYYAVPRPNNTNNNTTSVDVQGVDGSPYYAVSRLNNANQAANPDRSATRTNQASVNGSRRGPVEESRAVDSPPRESARQTAADGRIRAVRVEGDYYAVARDKNTNVRQNGSPDLIQFDQTNEQTRAASAGRMPASSATGQGARPEVEESPYYAPSEMYDSTDQDGDDGSAYSTPSIGRGGLCPVRR